MMTPVRSITYTDLVFLILGPLLLIYLTRKLVLRLTTPKPTSLKGPPNPSFFWGLGRVINAAPDQGQLFEEWAKEYGPVYQVNGALGTKRIALMDPRAVSHFYAKETSTFVRSRFGKLAVESLVGRSILWAEGEAHKRQRKAMSPAFSNAAIRVMTNVFLDSAYKLKDAWDSAIDSSASQEIIPDVQNWMNHISLDSIGIAGFSHDFGSLKGVPSTVASTFDSLGTIQASVVSSLLFILAQVFPLLWKVPTERRRMLGKLNHDMAGISEKLLARTRREREGDAKQTDRSVIGLLIKAESTESELHMTKDEVTSQMKLLILAGYETTSVSLTWCLIELARNPDIQTKLRQELLDNFSAGDPTWDQLTNGLPYLDAVVHETLRLHPPVSQTTRDAAFDDVIPLSEPLETATGDIVDRISVSKGTHIFVSIRGINRSEAIWGPDAKEFKPSRWLEVDGQGITSKAKEIQGHRHLLTFADGPRMCLGKNFALAEFKAVLTVLIRNYTFELRDGPDTKIEKQQSVLPRPKVAGEPGCRVPLRVRRAL